VILEPYVRNPGALSCQDFLFGVSSNVYEIAFFYFRLSIIFRHNGVSEPFYFSHKRNSFRRKMRVKP
ncbi:MAG: hypothetical protein UW40_C0013G0014, partial [Parcubacteria group bacterium GW2011_GWF2_44_17]